MNHKSYSMFQIPTVEVEIDNWETKKEQLLQLYENQSIERYEVEDGDTLYTNYFSEQCEVDDVNEILSDEINFFAKKLDIKKFELTHAWFQKYDNQDKHSIHTHGALGYSFVCFVHFNPEVHKSTTFISPFTNFIDGNVLSFAPDVNEGSIIFFPAKIMHLAPINNSDEPRLILSGNIKVDKTCA